MNLYAQLYVTSYQREALCQVAFLLVLSKDRGAAIKIFQGWSAYCASKAGLLHLTRVLAAEEPAITAVSLRPGVVDTQMQAEIRHSSKGAMPTARRERFRRLKRGGELAPPAAPARSIAWLALYAPSDWSGEFIEYDDPRVTEPAETVFGRVDVS